MTQLILSLGLLLFAPQAWAQTAAAPPPPAAAAPATPGAAATTTTTTTTTTTAPAAPAGDLNFDLFGDAAKPTAETTAAQVQATLDIERKVALRRRMLTVHQAVGFATLAMFAATLVIGQLNYQDKYVSGDFSGRYERTHLGLGILTTTMFATTGGLALFAPSPYEKKYRLDSAMVHRVSMLLSAIGMAAQIIMGPIITSRSGKLDQPKLALAHLITGYASFAFMATGTIAYVF